MAKKSKAKLKKEQANMQSDEIEMSSDGIQYTGDFSYTFNPIDDDIGTDLNTGGVGKTPTVDTIDTGFSYNHDFGQLDMFDEIDMREKYPALNQAYEHYKSVLEICKTKEKEENEN